MSMKAPYAIPRRVPKPTLDPAAFVFGYQAIENLKQELHDLKVQHEKDHAAKMQEVDKRLAQIDSGIGQLRSLHAVQKGEKGDPGDTPNAHVIEERVLARIPTPKDGQTPVVDHAAIVKKVYGQIVIPTPKPGKDADPAKVVDLVIEKIKQDKLLKPEHIDGLPRELTSYRAQLAGKHYGENTMVRGGGDTIAAGTGVSITVSNGVKTISASAGNAPVTVDLSAQCDGVNKVFTIPAFTSILHLLGTDFPIIYKPTTDFTAVGTALTIAAGVNAPSLGATLLLTYV